MALKRCPHLTASCPHYVNDCEAQESMDCHYVQMNKADTLKTAVLFKAVGSKKLPPEMKQYFHQQEAFLKEMGIS